MGGPNRAGLRRRVERLEDRSTPAAIPYAGGTYANHLDWLPAAGSYLLNTDGPYFFDAAPFSLGGAVGNHTPRGWQFARHGGSGFAAEFYPGDGGASTAGAYSFGAGPADRALGQLAGGQVQNTVGATFANTGTATYTRFTLSFTVEQWRRGMTPGPGYDTQAFAYAVGSPDVLTGAFTPAPAGDLVTVNPAAPAGKTDGNAAANRAARTVTVEGIVWPPGQILTVRWRDTNSPGNDDGLAVDDVAFAAGNDNPAGFAAGGVVVARVAAGAVTLDEFTPAGAAGTSVPVGTKADPFTLAAADEGLLTRTADGRALVLGGYRAAAGAATAGADRVVAVVAPDAGVDLSTRLPAGDLGAVRAVASAAGRGFFLATDAGVRYAP